MMTRFFSGSSTPRSARRNFSLSSSVTSGMRSTSRNDFSTSSRSPARRTPLSTKKQCSRSPIALWSSTATTVESTPPDTPHTTCPSPIRARRRSSSLAMNSSIVQLPESPATRTRKFSSSRMPWSVCTTSGWNCSP